MARGNRSFVVQHYRSRMEARLTDTDTGMRVTGDTAVRDERRTRRRNLRRRRARQRSACALAHRATPVAVGRVAGSLFGHGWPPVSVGSSPACSSGSRPGCPIRPRAWPAAARPACRARPASTARSALLTAACAAVPCWPARAAPSAVAAQARRRRALGGAGRAAARSAPRRAGTERAWRSGGAAAGCCTPSSATRWSPSGRRSRASPPGSPCRRCSNGRVPRSHRRSRRICSAGTAERRRELGTVFVFDPFALAGAVAHLVAAARGGHVGRALEVAWRLAAAGELDQRGVEGGDFWAIAAEQRLAPLLYAAAADRRAGSTRSFAGPTGRAAASCTRRWPGLTGEAADERELAGRQRRLRRGARVRGAGRPDPLLDRGDRPGAAARLPVRTGRAIGAARLEITADRLLDERATLYLIGDAKASKLLRPIFLALLSEIVDRAYERATLAGGARAAAAAVPRRGRQRRAAAEPGRDRVDRAEPQHPAGIDLPRPRAGAQPLRQARPRPSSTATAHGCCCPASPTSTRCATSVV